MAQLTQQSSYDIDEMSPRELELWERKRKTKKKELPPAEHTPFTFNGIPTY